jgi:acetyl esterase
MQVIKIHNWIKTVLMIAVLTQLPSCAIQKNAASEKLNKGFTILGFGDSITEGGPDFFSYLFPLDSMLKQSGYHAKFIGPRRSQRNGDTINHFGYGGRNAEYLAARIDSVYSLYHADLVILHAGHNHFIEEAPVPGIVAAQRRIIETVKQKNPSAIILVAAVITSGKLPKYDYIPDLNVSIKSMVDSFHDPAIVFVDQAKGWKWEENTISDKVHPNRAGANKIALNWFNGIVHLTKKKYE